MANLANLTLIIQAYGEDLKPGKKCQCCEWNNVKEAPLATFLITTDCSDPENDSDEEANSKTVITAVCKECSKGLIGAAMSEMEMRLRNK